MARTSQGINTGTAQVVAAVIALAGVLIVGYWTNAKPHPGKYTGYVFDAKNGQRIHKATVTLIGPGIVPTSQLSDTHGAFVFVFTDSSVTPQLHIHVDNSNYDDYDDNNVTLSIGSVVQCPLSLRDLPNKHIVSSNNQDSYYKPDGVQPPITLTKQEIYMVIKSRKSRKPRHLTQ
jgi:hypothetical protein